MNGVKVCMRCGDALLSVDGYREDLVESQGASQGASRGSVVKNPPANAGDVGLILGLRKSPGGGNGSLLLYSCLGNPMDRGIWRAIVCRVTKSWT